MEGDPEFHLPTRVPILDYDITNSEEMDDDHLIHNGETNNFEINDGENIKRERIYDEEHGLHYAPDEEVEENNPWEEDMLVPDIMRVNILVEPQEQNNHHNFYHGI